MSPAAALVLAGALAAPVHARTQAPAEPIERTPAPASAVLAPEQDTIPDHVDVPQTPEAEVAAPQEASGETRVADSETEYIIDTSSTEALDEDVAAAMEAPTVDPEVLERRSRQFLGAGAPLVVLGAAALIGGAVLGTLDDETDVGTQVWVPVMVGGAVLLAIGGPLAARGVVLKREARAGREALSAAQARVVVPSFGRTREGTWTGGLAARF